MNPNPRSLTNRLIVPFATSPYLRGRRQTAPGYPIKLRSTPTADLKVGRYVLQPYVRSRRPYLRYSVGTTAMFRNVDEISPHRMTMAIGV